MKRREYVRAVGTTSIVGVAGCTLEPRHQTSQEPGDGPGDPTPNEELPISDGEVEAVGTDTQEAVVKFVGRDGSGLGGTGWFVDERTVVTNSHVVQNIPPDVEVETYGGTMLEVDRLGFVESMDPDVAALTVAPPEEPDYTPLTAGASSGLEPGDPLVQVGHPGSIGWWAISVGGFTEKRDPMDWVLSTVPTLRGNSGSPVVDADGDVVGLTTGETWLDEPEDYRGEDAEVFRSYPARTRSTHVPIETVEQHVSGWR